LKGDKSACQVSDSASSFLSPFRALSAAFLQALEQYRASARAQYSPAYCTQEAGKMDEAELSDWMIGAPKGHHDRRALRASSALRSSAGIGLPPTGAITRQRVTAKAAYRQPSLLRKPCYESRPCYESLGRTPRARSSPCRWP